MSTSYKLIVNKYYNVLKIYSIDDVKEFVIAGNLTADEYKEITGQVYSK